MVLCDLVSKTWHHNIWLRRPWKMSDLTSYVPLVCKARQPAVCDDWRHTFLNTVGRREFRVLWMKRKYSEHALVTNLHLLVFSLTVPICSPRECLRPRSFVGRVAAAPAQDCDCDEPSFKTDSDEIRRSILAGCTIERHHLSH